MAALGPTIVMTPVPPAPYNPAAAAAAAYSPQVPASPYHTPAAAAAASAAAAAASAAAYAAAPAPAAAPKPTKAQIQAGMVTVASQFIFKKLSKLFGDEITLMKEQHSKLNAAKAGNSKADIGQLPVGGVAHSLEDERGSGIILRDAQIIKNYTNPKLEDDVKALAAPRKNFFNLLLKTCAEGISDKTKFRPLFHRCIQFVEPTLPRHNGNVLFENSKILRSEVLKVASGRITEEQLTAFA